MAPDRYRDVLTAAVVAAFVEYFGGTFLRMFWLFPLIEGHTFHSSFEWFDPLQLVDWAFAFALSFLVAAGVAWVFPENWLRVGLTCGVVAGLVHFLNSGHIFSPSTPPFVIAWVYGQYFIPLPGATAGAGMAHAVKSHASRSAI